MNSTKVVHYLAGIQRSGSTLLAKLLNQHPDVYASNTSPLFDLTLDVVKHISTLPESIRSNINLSDVLCGIQQGMYKSTTVKPHIVDKNRAWAPNFGNVLSDINPDARLILTLRPIEQVLTSFHHVLLGNGITATPEEIWKKFNMDEMIQTLYTSSAFKSKFLVVTYDMLTLQPKETLSEVETFLGLMHHQYDFSDILDDNPEDDTVWGINGLHAIRNVLLRNEFKPEEFMNSRQLNYCREVNHNLESLFGVKLNNL
jgi:sulfotransferase